jgi:ribosomal protein L21E
MVSKIGGMRRKTRHKLLKPRRNKGKISMTNFFQTFKEGEKVILKAESAMQKGMYFPRFHGKSGIIKKKVGSCYSVSITDGKKLKEPVVHPVHLKKTKV